MNPLAGIPLPVELVSLREAHEILKPVSITLEMVQRLADAGCLGAEYQGRFGRAFARSHVESLLQRPHLHTTTLHEYAPWQGIDQALVLRQIPAIPVPDEPDRPRRDFDDRAFIGAHVALLASPDPAVVRASEDAFRMYWPLSAPRERALQRALDAGQVVPLVTTVAKMVMAVRRIVAIEAKPEPWLVNGRRQHKVAYCIEAPGRWADGLDGAWLSSGPGPASIWWDRPGMPAP